MAKVLAEFAGKDRDKAHAEQARVIADGTAPEACCTEHVERGDTVIVWDETPSNDDLAKLAKRKKL